MPSEESNAEVAHVVICQCTSAKRDETVRAREIYDESDYYRKQRAYAEAVADAWYIQSAEHGLLHPETVIEPYDTRPEDLEDTEVWATKIAEGLGEYHPDGDVVVEVLGGAAYADPLTPELEHLGFEVLEPLRGQRIGERKRSLKQMANRRLGGFA